jgi:hypothetical protein
MENKNIEIYLGPRARVYRDTSFEYIRNTMTECDCGHLHLFEGHTHSDFDYALYNIPKTEADCISSELLKDNGLAVKITDSNKE